MKGLPLHGRVNCTKCFSSEKAVEFDVTKRTEGKWRITANPCAWGNHEPEVLVLGFSKGPTQAGALVTFPHDEIAYKGGRKNIGKIFQHIGLIPPTDENLLAEAISDLISDKNGRFHFASLNRCTVEQLKTGEWKATGGGILDKFIESPFGKEISTNCSTQFLKDLPTKTKLIVMFGTGSKLNYVRHAFELYKKVRGGEWAWINEVSYTDGKIVVVHTEHFISQGSYISDWLGKDNHPRGLYGVMAKQAVANNVHLS